MDFPLSELISAASAILGTSIAFSRVFFVRLSKIEDTLTESIKSLNQSIAELDKRLAVNSCIIDQFLEERCTSHGTRRNKEIS